MGRWALVLFCIFWALFSWYTPASSYWRDSGEFIISGTFLDIAHPAGFPLYSQLAHLFSHIPFGSLAWRINLFSTFIAALSLSLTYLMSRKILEVECRLPQTLSRIIAPLSCILLAFSETFMRQAFLAEVYLLNAVIIQILFLLVHTWYHSNDRRYLYIATFIAGLSIGNHISIALAFLFMLIPLSLSKRRLLDVLLPSFLLFALGTLIYLYIPLRAQTKPILNTGQADTVGRFFNLVTNQRDWEIRGQQVDGKINAAKLNFHILDNFSWQKINLDLNTLSGQSSPLALILALLGLIVLFLKRHFFTASTLCAIAASNWVFFAGWHPDPWVPILIVAALLSPLPLAALMEQPQSTKHKKTLTRALCLTGALLLALGSLRADFAKELVIFKKYEMAREDAKLMVKSSEANAYILTEPSLFNLLYLTSVEGYRDDLTIIYLLDLYYPELFNKRAYYRRDGATFTPKELPLPHPANLDNVSQFISFSSAFSPIEMEPVTLLNQYLRNVVNLDSKGRVTLIPGKGSNIAPDFFNQALSEIEILISHFYEMPKSISGDVGSRIELRAMMLADLYYQLGMPLRSVQILKLLCDQPNQPGKNLCFKPIENNLRAYKALLYDESDQKNVSH